MPRLHETLYGKKLLKKDIPEMVESLQKISRSLAYANQLKEEELSLKKMELELRKKELEMKSNGDQL